MSSQFIYTVFMINMKLLSVVTPLSIYNLLSPYFLYSCKKDMFYHDQVIYVFVNNNIWNFLIDENKYMNGTHIYLHYFMHQEQIHQDIHCNNLTRMNNLATWCLFQESHTYWQIQNIDHCQVIQLHYIWTQYFLH